MDRFRKINLNSNIAGNLSLHSMPGIQENVKEFFIETKQNYIDRIICLPPLSEIQMVSSDYFDMIQRNEIPIPIDFFPIANYSIPEKCDATIDFISKTANHLKEGTNLLVHCQAGQGRTGTIAVCILIALGIPYEESLRLVIATGSEPECPKQVDFVVWFNNHML